MAYPVVTLVAASAALVLSTQLSAADMLAEHDGGTVSIHFAPVSENDTALRGIVRFDNAPGWKTYWRDPGTSGIPPQLSFMIAGEPLQPVLHYPLPQWIADDYGGFIGYVGQSSVAFELPSPAASGADFDVSVNLFAGVCREVCIPVSGQVTTKVKAASPTMTSLEQSRVDLNFSQLPQTEHPAVSLRSAQKEADGSVIVTLSGAQPKTGFAVGTRNDAVVTSFGPPQIETTGHDTTVLRFQPRGNHEATTDFDFHLVASVAPFGFQVTIPAADLK